MIAINTENAKEHWQFINVKDRTVLDLGCGRWDRVETVDNSWLTTPEHFISHGANKVIALDTDLREIEWFSNKFNNDNRYEFVLKHINSPQDILDLYNLYKPDCVKCDIETGERYLLQLSIEQFCSIKEYYIETHGMSLYHHFLDIFPKYGYTIREQIDLIHTHNDADCRVIFAYKS